MLKEKEVFSLVGQIISQDNQPSKWLCLQVKQGKQQSSLTLPINIKLYALPKISSWAWEWKNWLVWLLPVLSLAIFLSRLSMKNEVIKEEDRTKRTPVKSPNKSKLAPEYGFKHTDPKGPWVSLGCTRNSWVTLGILLKLPAQFLHLADRVIVVVPTSQGCRDN